LLNRIISTLDSIELLNERLEMLEKSNSK